MAGRREGSRSRVTQSAPSEADLAWFKRATKIKMQARTVEDVRIAKRLLRLGKDGRRRQWAQFVVPMQKFLSHTQLARPELFPRPKGDAGDRSDERPRGVRATAGDRGAPIPAARRLRGFRVGRVTFPAPPAAPKDPSFLPELQLHLKMGRYDDASTELRRATRSEKEPAMQAWLREQMRPALERLRNGPIVSGPKGGKTRCRACGLEFKLTEVDPESGRCGVCLPKRSTSIRTVPGGSPGLGKKR